MVRRALLIVCALMIFSGIGRAQDDPSLFMIGRSKGDDVGRPGFYRYQDSAWELVPIEDFAGGRVSPDGEWLVYQRVPPFLKTLDEGMGVYYGSAWDLVLLNLRNDTTRIVAVQPETITAKDIGYQGGMNRALPVWSADSRMFAWVEQDYPAQNTARLVVYDLDTDTSRVLDDAVPQMWLSDDGMPSVFAWGPTWLSVFTNDPNDGAPTLRLYNPRMDKRKVIRLTLDEDYEWWPNKLIWLHETESEAERVVFRGRHLWHMVDAITEEETVFNSRLEMVGTSAESLRFVRDIYDGQVDTQDKEPKSETWQLLKADGQEMTSGELNDYSPMLALSPHGDQAVVLDGDETAFTLWTADGKAASLSLPEGLGVWDIFWGPSQWREGEAYRPIEPVGGVGG